MKNSDKDINKRALCTGCGACKQACSKNAISMKMDNEGFYYPNIDSDKCIDCGLCQRVCPLNQEHSERYPIEAKACVSYDENIRMKSSSGGVFSLLSEYVFSMGGVVFGVAFDENWNTVHTSIKQSGELYRIQGSKYVQSNTSNTFREAKQFLKDGLTVLYSGTPCQIAALKSFLGKDHSNLITVDLVCHGAPSPGIWQYYLKSECIKAAQRAVVGKSTVLTSLKTTLSIEGVNFRDKSDGWKKFRFVLSLAEPSCEGKKSSVLSFKFMKSPFMRLFLKDVILRPSCYDCQFKKGKAGADITLADFWHINSVIPDFNDDKGCTLVYLNTKKAVDLFKDIACDVRDLSIEDATKRKYAWWQEKRKIPSNRDIFFKNYMTKGDFCAYANNITKDPLKKRIKKFIKKIINKVGL